LLKNKSLPEAAANNAAAWVISEREMRERLRREQDAREAKEKTEVSLDSIKPSRQSCSYSASAGKKAQGECREGEGEG